VASPNFRGAMLFSILAAVVTIGLKAIAYLATGSVGLFSDALESGVNLIAAVTGYVCLWYAARPPDATHTYGHEKIEFFSSGIEGVLIALAGVSTVGFAIHRLVVGGELQQIDLGVALTLVATFINFAVGMYLVRFGKKHNSLLVEADGQHLLSDVWTSLGIVLGLGFVVLTGLAWLDAVAGIAVGTHITYIGFHLVRRSFDGLMDRALRSEEQTALRASLQAALPTGATFHMLRTRQAGRRVFVEFHLLLDGNMTVSEAHRHAHEMEQKLRTERPELNVTIHIEPIHEQTAWEVQELQQLGETP
jgi:cation diffusion facilitator family transporter